MIFVRRFSCAIFACLLLFFSFSGIFSPAQASGILIIPFDDSTGTSIPDQAYYGDSTLKTVIIPEGITSIGSLAFANSSVSVLTLPTSLKHIADDAFQGTNLTTVNAKSDSYGYNWARDHGFFPQYKALLIGEKTFLEYNPYGQSYYTSTASRNVGDVNNMASMLSSVYGPQGGRFSVTKKNDLTYGEVHSAIQSAFSGTKSQDVCLFFIASHGNEAGDGDLFMAFKGDHDNKEDRDAYYNGNQLLSFETLASWLNESCGGRAIVIIEACGSGSAIYTEETEENGLSSVLSIHALSSSSLSGLKAKMDFESDSETLPTEINFDPEKFNQAAVSAFSAADPGFFLPSAVKKPSLKSTGNLRTNKFYVLTAARHHEMSYGIEGDKAQNYFTKWLIEGIGSASSSPADLSPADNILTLDELFAYIRDNYNDYSFGTLADGTVLCQHVQCYPQGSLYPLFSLIKVPKDISGAVVSGLSDLEYTGSIIEPEFTVELGDDILAAGLDYEPAWSDNLLPGIASLTLTGKGSYTGFSESEFIISPADVSVAEIQIVPSEALATGYEITPSCKVLFPNGLEATGVVTYSDNVSPGTATAVFSGDGYFTGEIHGTFTILDPNSFETLFLPNNLVTIEDSAFEGIAAQYIIIPDGTKSIGTKAFANCKNLLQIKIPSTVTRINEDSFDGCNGLIIIGSEGSAAQMFVEAYGERLELVFLPEI